MRYKIPVCMSEPTRHLQSPRIVKAQNSLRAIEIIVAAIMLVLAGVVLVFSGFAIILIQYGFLYLCCLAE